MVTELGASDRMRDHWWWRPGWSVGTRMYTWHVTFGGQAALHQITERYQAALGALPGVDLIPLQWLHLTMQGVGFTDQVPDAEVRKITAAAEEHLTAHPPITFTVGAPIVDPEAILFRVEPADQLRRVRDSVRAAITDVWGAHRVPDAPEWTPHVSLAYSNGEGSAAPYLEAVHGVAADPVTVTVNAVQLIRLDRDTKVYKWDTVASVPLGG
ncbi:hypothetical protein Skr01_06950 [Sphaerisporangium krabiense]|uniref:2'-5' RNA ligase n=1 Tax=Sphaerisporangium krabiense TaxID=763782 RepID=A0A7W8ZCZ1_9ACTN|nr:2'-5' RNA ligase family protein [Sphaerisporangium krabiense]MBB5631754.1 2'-5' RNA ligase [Sphaerisporangium krabiense]GII60610.1 hypothetical protein Skr01_06950 [Sphaerisporangium krabiense]